MKNIITEELGYMKYLLGYQRGVVISEQANPISKKEKNVQAAYQLMIDGADGRFGMGTEVQKIIDGINMIKSEDELDRLFTLFKDKKTGYSDFSEMIIGEFESDNQKDLDKIVSKLNTWYDLKKETLLSINIAIDSLSTEILFLKSWFLLLSFRFSYVI